MSRRLPQGTSRRLRLTRRLLAETARRANIGPLRTMVVRRMVLRRRILPTRLRALATIATPDQLPRRQRLIHHGRVEDRVAPPERRILAFLRVHPPPILRDPQVAVRYQAVQQPPMASRGTFRIRRRQAPLVLHRDRQPPLQTASQPIHPGHLEASTGAPIRSPRLFLPQRLPQALDQLDLRAPLTRHQRKHPSLPLDRAELPCSLALAPKHYCMT